MDREAQEDGENTEETKEKSREESTTIAQGHGDIPWKERERKKRQEVFLPMSI